MKMLKRILKLAGLLLLVVFIIATLAFTSAESRNIACSNIEVVFDDDDLIKVDKNKLVNIVKSADKKILEKTMGEINGEELEHELGKIPAILSADTYKLIVNEEGKYKGVLVVKVKHRKPVMRVVGSSGNYYLDENGVRIPASINYSTNVLVTTGAVSEKFAVEKLLPFILYVQNNEFWQAQIEQIHVEEDGDILLVPMVGDHVIELGDVENYSEKLNVMRAFYKQVLVKNNWDKYDKISLKYNNQVVAKRR
jgi:cell division protein FtsQ